MDIIKLNLVSLRASCIHLEKNRYSIDFDLYTLLFVYFTLSTQKPKSLKNESGGCPSRRAEFIKNG